MADIFGILADMNSYLALKKVMRKRKIFTYDNKKFCADKAPVYDGYIETAIALCNENDEFDSDNIYYQDTTNKSLELCIEEFKEMYDKCNGNLEKVYL